MNAYFLTIPGLTNQYKYFSASKNGKSHVVTFTNKTPALRFASILNARHELTGTYPTFEECYWEMKYGKTGYRSKHKVVNIIKDNFETMEYYFTLHDVNMLVHEHGSKFSQFPKIELDHSVYAERLDEIYQNGSHFT